MTETKNLEAIKASSTLAEYRAAGGEPHSGKNWRILEKLVAREVVQCVSGLVSHFAQNEGALEGSEYSYDDVLDLCTNRPDHSGRIEEIEQEIEELEADLEDADEATDTLDNGRTRAKIEKLTEEKEDLEGEQDEPNEVYEHWIVSDWFAGKLKERGETTGELFNLTIWGRCTTGQAISIDHVISEIAAEMQILEGQAREWTE
jgi:hypothetical protein